MSTLRGITLCMLAIALAMVAFVPSASAATCDADFFGVYGYRCTGQYCVETYIPIPVAGGVFTGCAAWDQPGGEPQEPSPPRWPDNFPNPFDP